MSQVTEVCFTSTIFHLSSFRLSRWLTRVLNDPHSRGLWCLELRQFLEVGGVHTLPDQAPPLAASAPAEPEGGGKVVGTVTDQLFLHGHCVYCLYININHHLHKHTDRVRGFRLVRRLDIRKSVYSQLYIQILSTSSLPHLYVLLAPVSIAVNASASTSLYPIESQYACM